MKRDQKKEEKEEVSLESLIDTERSALGPNVTKVTLDTFLAWKKRKLQEKKEALAADRAKKKKNLQEGKMSKVGARREVRRLMAVLYLLYDRCSLLFIFARNCCISTSRPSLTVSPLFTRFPSDHGA